MSRTQGFSTISMAMLLLLPGSLMLNGLQQYLSMQRVAVNSESRAIKAFAQASVALEWASRQPWQPEEQWQCRVVDMQPGRGCVLRLTQQRVVVVGQSAEDTGGLTLWRGAISDGDKLSVTSQGWSDFCPLREPGRCLLP